MSASTEHPRDELLDAICRVAAHGETDRGSDGVILFDRVKETVAWAKVSEVSSEELRETAADMLSEEGGKFYFVIEEDTDARQVHIWKLSRFEVSSRLANYPPLQGTVH